MTSKTLHTRIINKHALEFDWIKAVNFIPKQGEIIVYDVESTDGINLIEGVTLPEDRSTPYTYERFKIGDGIHYVNDLPFAIDINEIPTIQDINDTVETKFNKCVQESYSEYGCNNSFEAQLIFGVRNKGLFTSTDIMYEGDEGQYTTTGKIEEIETKVDNAHLILEDAIYVSPQSLTDEQKAQARENIGAVSVNTTKNIESVEEREYTLIDGTIIKSGSYALTINDTEEVSYETNEILPTEHYKVFVHNGCYRLEASNIIPGTFELYKDWTNLIKIAEQGEHIVDENNNVVNENIYHLVEVKDKDSVNSVEFEKHQLDGYSNDEPIDGIFKITNVYELMYSEGIELHTTADTDDSYLYMCLRSVTDEQKSLIKVGNQIKIVTSDPYDFDGTPQYQLTEVVIYDTCGESIGTIDLLSGYIEFNDNFLEDNISSDESYEFSELYAAFKYKYQASGNIAGGNWSSTSGSRNTNISGKGTVGGENNYLKGTQGRVHGMSNTLFSRHGSADGFHNFVEATSDNNINDSVAITGYANYILDSSGADASGHHNMVLKGIDSTAKGFRNIVKALYGFVHGQHNIVTNNSQTVIGKFNDYKKSKENGDLFTVGNGKNFENGKALVRSNAFGVREDGTAYVKAQGESDDSVVKKEYVDDEISKLSSKIDNSSQVAPEFVQDISQCVDTTKMYVLPDGFLYAYAEGVPEVTYETHLNSILTHSSGADRYTLKTGGKYHLKNSNILPAKEGDIFEYYGFENYNAAVYWLKEPINTINEILDSNIVGIEKSTDSPYDSAKVTMQFTTPKDTKYVLFVSISNNANNLDLKVTPPSMYYWMNTGIQFIANNYEERIQELENELKNSIGGVLGGKKYVACGDSFTAGLETYPNWIAGRNNMDLTNLAKSGSDFTSIEGAKYPFSADTKIDETHKIYKDIPTDADYITLMFGLNECQGEENLPTIGTKEDTTNTTLWGAYNIVFEYLLTNMPYAKIGVIIADAWMKKNYADTVKEICKYWGIPYLDLNDETVPMGIRGRYYGEDVSPRAIELRDAAFKVSDTDEHPNAEAHKYRSTIIENFMRSL